MGEEILSLMRKLLAESSFVPCRAGGHPLHLENVWQSFLAR